MSTIFSLDEWFAIVERGTSGDQVYDILYSWKAERDELQRKLDIAVEASKALLYAAEMRRNWDILSSDDFDEAYPDECGWAFGDVDENMIQKMEMAQKVLVAIEKVGKDE